MVRKQSISRNPDIERRASRISNFALEPAIHHASDIYGQWGPVQRNATIIYIILGLMSGFQNVGITFQVPQMPYECRRPAGYETANATLCHTYGNSSEPCREWTYDTSVYGNTLINEVSGHDFVTVKYERICDSHYVNV